MRIAVDMLVGEKEPGGMLFAAQALLEGLAQLDHKNEYIIITAHPHLYQKILIAPHMSVYSVPLRFGKGILIQHQLLMPEILRQLRPDVLHVPAFAAPIGWHGPLVLTVHDLAFLKLPCQSSFYTRLYWQCLLRESVRRAQSIIAVSRETYNDLLNHWAVEPERIHLVHNALRSSLMPANTPLQSVQAMQHCIGGRYLLHVGRVMPRKNVEVLLEAFNLLAHRFEDLHLVMTGGMGYGSRSIREQIVLSPYHKRIHLLGWVPDNELGVLYAGARAMVFPSIHEGFGLPVLEAMACGTPVIASPTVASAAIAGEAVMQVDCTHAATLAEAISNVLTDDTLYHHLVDLGRVHAQAFTHTACAEATMPIYQEALVKAQSENGVTMSNAAGYRRERLQ